MRSYFLNRLNSLKNGRFGRRSWTLSRLQAKAYQLGTNLEVIFCGTVPIPTHAGPGTEKQSHYISGRYDP